jgi:peptidoglycan/LPS O-acetylase OafA/YrhL
MIVNIQFLRAIAALLVVFYHTSDHFFVVGGNTSGNIFSFFSKIGYIGVDIFFVISGYIMWITTKKLHSYIGAKKFIYARLTRIYLTYWFFLSFMIFFYHRSLYNFDLIGSIFLTVSSPSKLLLQVAWTLQYELYFYVFFTFLLFFQRKYLIKFLVITFILIIIIQVYASIYVDVYNKAIFNEASTLWTFWTSPFILEFLMGSFVGYYFDKYRIKNLLPLSLAITSLLIVAFWFQKNYLDGSLVEGYFLRERVFFLGLFSMGVLAILIEYNKRNIILFPKFSLLLGGASYSLYLSHNIILLFIYQIGIRDAIGAYGKNQLFFMLLIILLIISYSIVHYLFIEKKVMSYAKKFQP